MHGVRFSTLATKLRGSGAAPLGRRPNAVSRPRVICSRGSRGSGKWRRRVVQTPARTPGNSTIAACSRLPRTGLDAVGQFRGLPKARRQTQFRSRAKRLHATCGRGMGPSCQHLTAGKHLCRDPGPLVRAKPKRNTQHHQMDAFGEAAVWLARLPESVKPFLAVREAELCCPTCNARQAPSLECRRCKSDLSLVVAVHDQLRRLHATVLRQLAAGNYAEAVGTARSYWAISPNPLAARLMAVCCLLQTSYSEAQDIACNAADRPRAATGRARW